MNLPLKIANDGWGNPYVMQSNDEDFAKIESFDIAKVIVISVNHHQSLLDLSNILTKRVSWFISLTEGMLSQEQTRTILDEIRAASELIHKLKS